MPIVDRTKVFSLKIIKCYGWLKKQEEECQIMGRQLFKNATSIGANIRESRSALSDKDFLHKLEIALKETRKTQYWLELLIESELVNKNKFQPLLNEANEIGKILVTSTKTMKNKLKLN